MPLASRGFARTLPLPLLLILTLTAGACGVLGKPPAGDSETDRQAETLAIAIEYPRQSDAAGLARAALSVWSDGPRNLAILEMTDLHPSSPTEPAARLTIRIHEPAHRSDGFGDEDSPALDACYMLEYLMPSSSLLGKPERIACPSGAKPITPPPAPPVPHLPAHAARTLAKVLRSLPTSPTRAQASQALRAAFPPPAYGDAIVDGKRVAMAVGMTGGDVVRDCVIELRTGRRVEQVHPDPITLQPGEMGCTAEQATDPVTTH